MTRTTSKGSRIQFLFLAAALGLAIFAAFAAGAGGVAVPAAIGALLLVASRLWLGKPATSEPRPTQSAQEGASRSDDSDDSDGPASLASAPAEPEESEESTDSPSDRLVATMIEQGREVLLLRPQIAPNLTPAQLRQAQDRLDEVMAIVPQGPVVLFPRETDRDYPEDGATPLVEIDGYYLDRYPVTNRQFKAFVDAEGYEQMSLWDEEIWPAVLEFVDLTGHPGPRFWEHGRFPAELADHPVVGVSWYEASAFARWAGKRLPTDPEWVKSGAWPVTADSGLPAQRRFPWGESMDRGKAHLWGPTVTSTVPVTATPGGASVGGIHQLIGNVWEWTSSPFAAWDQGVQFCHEKPFKAIRGGAFDTYFDCQASCQFQSGEDPLARKHNIGFRCAVGVCDVEPVAWNASQDSAPSPFDSIPEEAVL